MCAGMQILENNSYTILMLASANGNGEHCLSENKKPLKKLKYCATAQRVSVPGLLAVEQTKSAFRGRRSSCRVTEPLEADTDAGSEDAAAAVFLGPAGSPFRRSSSALSASLLSAGGTGREKSGVSTAANVHQCLVFPLCPLHFNMETQSCSLCFITGSLRVDLKDVCWFHTVH